ncbi:MAG: molybdenum cofactor biosynthesis protein MoaE [Betaproteobacteria bacterium]|nr:molybdenum cofactor biosynthesis protein MoaE [Betaproteobacteria bacterium]
MPVRIQTEDFDPGAELAAFSAGDTRIGAIASFIGLVRDAHEAAPDQRILEMTLEHYPGMTEKALQGIVEEAKTRWPVFEILVIHRVGKLFPNERIVFVATSAAHRGDAFHACEFVMDYLKTRAPFWKRERTPTGAHWVDARESDDVSAARWGG